MGTLAIVSVAVGVGPVIHAEAADGGSVAVTGYAEQGTALSVGNTDAAALTTVGVDGVNLDNTGDQVSTPSKSALALLAGAHADGLRAELLIGNYDNAINNFSPQIAADLLDSSTNISTVASALAGFVSSEGWDGITVDLESLTPQDSSGLVNFVTTLRHDVGATQTVSIDLTASPSLSGYQALGYDLAGLSAVVNRIVLMTYDEHGPWSQPGPIGGLGWQRHCLATLRQIVPADQVDLGVAGYGYTWPAGKKRHDGTQVSDAQARALVADNGATARWVPKQGEWTATLSSGTVLWWSDARSYALRFTMAQTNDLHGLALWQLSTADPLT
jgi:spore germination protein YaaH